MNTREVLEIIAEQVPKDTAFIASLGRTSEETFRLFPDQTLFLDSMGDVTTVACGVALGLGATHPVVALDTDGSHLMGLSSLSTLATLVDRLPNLLLIVLDNGLYESGGGLPSRYTELDWQLLGQAYGMDCQVVNNKKQLLVSLQSVFSRFSYIITKIENTDNPPAAQKSLDGVEAKYRFSRHLERLLQKPLLRPSVKS